MTRFHFSRRKFLAVALAGSLSFGLAACGSGGQNPSAADGATRIVKDVDGNDVEVPENPQRIVALSEPTMDAVLAMGIKPVGVIQGRGQETVAPYLFDKAADIPLLGTVSQLNFEAIGAVQPDLIVVDGTSVNNDPVAMETLRQIAPTVYTGYAGGDWRKNLEFVADALNEQQAGQNIIADYDKRVASMKEQLAEYSDNTFSIVRWQGNAAALILKELPAGATLEDLGLKRPANQDRRGRGHSDPVSAENIADIDADYLFFGTLGGSSVGNPNAGGEVDAAAAEETLKNAETVPGFKDLTAYKNDHIIPVDGATWTSTGGPLLIQSILDDVEANLIDKKSN